MHIHTLTGADTHLLIHARHLQTHETHTHTHTGGAEVNKDVLKDEGVHANEKYSKKKHGSTLVQTKFTLQKNKNKFKCTLLLLGARAHTQTHTLLHIQRHIVLEQPLELCWIIVWQTCLFSTGQVLQVALQDLRGRRRRGRRAGGGLWGGGRDGEYWGTVEGVAGTW